jgi:3-methyladenine DNA glycosylase AlkD
MHTYLIPLQALFQKHTDEKNALASKAYLRNQFEHYGLKADLRRNICREFMKKNTLVYRELPAIVKECWKLPQREWQYFAVELAASMKKAWDEKIIRLIETLIIRKSWWDSVDHVASELTGPYFTLYPRQIHKITAAWNLSDNIWLQRSSIMFQKSYRQKTNSMLLSRYILRLTDSDEFFVQKAIGWALREYSKTNPDWVVKFVTSHPQLPLLSRREALKRIKK